MPEEHALSMPEIAIAAISLSLFLSSFILWIGWGIQRVRSGRSIGSEWIQPWQIGWVNFGIFFCGLICLTFAVQVFLASIIKLVGAEEISTVWLMAIGALSIQSAFLIGYACCRKYFPEIFRGNLHGRSLNSLRAFYSAFLFFLRSLPIIFIVAFTWNAFLGKLVEMGLIDSFPPQEAVLAFSSGESPIALGVIAFAAILLAPLAEEIIFRGCIYRFFKSRVSTHQAMWISAFTFGLIHGNLMALVPLTVVGFLLAYSYEREGNLLIPIFFHGIFNCFTLTMTSLYSISGQPLPY